MHVNHAYCLGYLAWCVTNLWFQTLMEGVEKGEYSVREFELI